MAKQEIVDTKPQVRTNKKNNLPQKKPKNQMMVLIDKAITNNIPVEQLKELMQLKREYDQQQAEKIFNEKFSEFQQSLPVVKKTRKVCTKSGKLAYKYASLDDIIKNVKPVFAKYKFAYKWSEEVSETPGHKKIICTISGWGHSISSSMDLPLGTGTDMNSAVQLEGIRNTYGKRYTFCAVTGITPEEDIDGANIQIDDTSPLIPEIEKKWKAILDTGYKPKPGQKKAIDDMKKYNPTQLKDFSASVDVLYNKLVLLKEIGQLFADLGFDDKENQKQYIYGVFNKEATVTDLSLDERSRLRDVLRADVKDVPNE